MYLVLLPLASCSEYLASPILEGRWAAPRAVPGLLNLEGRAASYFFLNYSSDTFGLHLTLYDPYFVDGDRLVVRFGLPESFQRFEPKLLQFDTVAALLYQSSSKGSRELSCPSALVVQILEREQVQVRLQSSECGLQFQSRLRRRGEDETLRLLGFSALTAAVVVGTVLSAKRLRERLAQSYNEQRRLSQTSLFLLIYLMGWESMYLVFLGITNMAGSLLGLLLLMLGTGYFLSALGLTLKIVAGVWRASLVQPSSQELRRAVMMFYAKFYLGNLVFFVLVLKYSTSPLFLFCQTLLLLPQFLKNAVRGSGARFYPELVLGLTGLNLLIPVYMRSCPYNIEALTPSPWFFSASVLSYGLLAALLYLQDRLGARFFIPKRLIPNYYDYERIMVFSEEGSLERECTICLLPLAGTDNDADLPVKVKVWTAPCLHHYHPKCLRTWLDVKLQCPSCRMALPAP